MKVIFMMLSLFALFLTLVYPAIAAASPVAIPALGIDLLYPVQDMQYVGKIGGYEVNLNGTVQDIMAQMATLYPEFDPASLPPVVHNTTLKRREADNKDGLICVPVPGQSWIATFAGNIRLGITLLSSLGRIGILARTCARLSCHNYGGIFVCNDNDVTIWPAMPYLATYAQDMIDQCSEGSGPDQMVGGQEFDSDRYNVIVKTPC